MPAGVSGRSPEVPDNYWRSSLTVFVTPRAVTSYESVPSAYVNVFVGSP